MKATEIIGSGSQKTKVPVLLTVVATENWADEHGKLGEGNKENERGNEGQETHRAVSKKKKPSKKETETMSESGSSLMRHSRRSKPKKNSSGLQSESRKSKNWSRGKFETKGGRRGNGDPDNSSDDSESNRDDRRFKRTQKGGKRMSKEGRKARWCDDDSDTSSSASSPNNSSDDSSSADEKSGRRRIKNARGRKKGKWGTRSSVRNIFKIKFRVLVKDYGDAMFWLYQRQWNRLVRDYKIRERHLIRFMGMLWGGNVLGVYQSVLHEHSNASSRKIWRKMSTLLGEGLQNP